MPSSLKGVTHVNTQERIYQRLKMNEQYAQESSEAIEIKKRQRIRELVEEVIAQYGIENVSTEQIVEEVMKRV